MYFARGVHNRAAGVATTVAGIMTEVPGMAGAAAGATAGATARWERRRERWRRRFVVAGHGWWWSGPWRVRDLPFGAPPPPAMRPIPWPGWFGQLPA